MATYNSANVGGHKHIANANKLEHIKQVCQEAGFQPITICTPAELLKEYRMKERQEEYTNSILEECYRIKNEINAQFKTIEELSAYLKHNKKRTNDKAGNMSRFLMHLNTRH